VSRLIVAADNPPEPRNCSNAGPQSKLDWSACASMYAATSAYNAAANILQAPSGTISSNNEPPT
jgi:hypothetical protein